MQTAFLGLGSNLGDRGSSIREAVDRLDKLSGTRVVKVSSLYETAPVGYEEQPDFLNAVVQVQTELSPTELLRAVLGIEHDMGRVRSLRWGPRVIDIDILLYDNVTIRTADVEIPHPRMAERAFVIAPLAEIAPDIRLPDGRTPPEVLGDLGHQRVQRIEEPRE